MSARRIAAIVPLLACLEGVAAAPAPGTPVPSTAPGGTVTVPIDPGASLLTFTIHRPGETIDGAVREFAGEIVFDPADLSAGSSVVLRVTAASLATGNRMRDRKMRGSHLEVERYPAIVFKSTSIKVGSERGGPQRKALVEGVLSLHGVDRALMVPAAIRYDGGVLTAEGSVALTYSDYGIPIPRFLWLVMEDDIQVRFRFVTEAAVR